MNVKDRVKVVVDKLELHQIRSIAVEHGNMELGAAVCDTVMVILLTDTHKQDETSPIAVFS